MQRHSYLTRRVYNNHPIGSKCYAFRVDGGRTLAIEFDNGDVVEVPTISSVGIQDCPWASSLEEDLISLCGDAATDRDFIEAMQEMIMDFKREVQAPKVLC